MFSRWFQRSKSENRENDAPSSPRVPTGMRVYVIGDIHGRIDLLQQIETKIARDLDQTGPASAVTIYLGDYVDRGYNSKDVLDHLLDRPVPGTMPVWLLGNHDVWLRDFARDRSDGANWLAYGGDATLLSYGVRLDPRLLEPERLAEARVQLKELIPDRHLEFIDRMELGFSLGDYFFVHAGVHPSRPLDEQRANEMLWIRDPFLFHEGDFGKIVVHGHTVVERPEIHANRIAIDTGACWTGQLTCLVLDDTDRRFLATGPNAAMIEAQPELAAI